MPWFHIPEERRTVFIEPLQPSGGLLGGSSGGTTKVSKLAALAAARKRKAEAQKSGSGMTEVDEPMAGLTLERPFAASQQMSSQESVTGTEKQRLRSYTARKRKNSSPHRKIEQSPKPVSTPPTPQTPEEPSSPSVMQLAPSAFASTMFGSATNFHSAGRLFTLPPIGACSIDSTNAFTGPSPDDVVAAAQSKGSAHVVKPKA